MSKIKEKIYNVYDDENYKEKYSKIINSYHRIKEDSRFNDEFKKEAKEKAKDMIKDLQQKKTEKVNSIIEDFEEDQEFKFPEQPEFDDKEDELLYATKKNTQLSILREEIKSSSPKELVDMVQEYEEDPTLAREVDRLVRAELKQRGESSKIDLIENSRNTSQPEINQAKSLKKTFSSGELIPVKENEEADAPGFRNIERDLEKGTAPIDGVDSSIINNLKGVETNEN